MEYPTVMAAPRLLVSAGLVWLAHDRLLLGRRSPEAAHGAGALEFPGGKVEPGESPRAALLRELREEWGAGAGRLAVGPVAEVLHHVYPPPGPEVVLCVFHVDGRALLGRWTGELQALPGAGLEEYAREDLPIEQFLAADRPFAVTLRAGELRCPFVTGC